MTNGWPEPAWIAELHKEKRDAARVRYFINLAATYASEKGTLIELSKALGVTYPALNSARARGAVAPELAVKIEGLLGRDRFPRELFNDIFALTER